MREIHTEISNLQIKLFVVLVSAQVANGSPVNEQLLVLNGIKEANANGQYSGGR
jgi:hypothetical protein